MGSASHSPMITAGRRHENAAGGPDQASADDAHQDGAFKGDVGGVEVAHPLAHQTPRADRNPDNQNDFDLLAQSALFAKQQHAEAPGAHQHAADRRGHAEADQNGDENELVNPKQPASSELRCWHYPIAAGGFAEGLFGAGGIGCAALRHVAVASAASSQLLHRVFHQRAHVVRETRGLRENQDGCAATATHKELPLGRGE